MSRHILKMKINALEPEEKRESPEYFEKEQGQPCELTRWRFMVKH